MLSYVPTNATLVGHYNVRPGQIVYINDSSIFLTPGENVNIAQEELRKRDAEVQLRIFLNGSFDSQVIDVSLTSYSAHFGTDLSHSAVHSTKEIPRIRKSEGVVVRRDPKNLRGCNPYEQSYPDSILVVHRGDCTFLEKLLKARDAEAAGIVVISNEDIAIHPTASSAELALAGDLSDVGVVLLTNQVGQAFEDMLASNEKIQAGQIMLALERAQDVGSIEDTEHVPPVDKESEANDLNRILYINGHPLINTRLLI